LNTSFNLHGEPIVQTPEDALSVFQRTELDALLLDGYLIEGNAQNEK
jgi:carbamoyltransferase